MYVNINKGEQKQQPCSLSSALWIFTNHFDLWIIILNVKQININYLFLNKINEIQANQIMQNDKKYITLFEKWTRTFGIGILFCGVMFT